MVGVGKRAIDKEAYFTMSPFSKFSFFCEGDESSPGSCACEEKGSGLRSVEYMRGFALRR